MKKCSICGQKCGFFESYHKECKIVMDATVPKMDAILNEYKNGKLVDGKREMINFVNSEPLYRIYLLKHIWAKDQIYNNETTLYVVNMVSVSEWKNRCTMVRTGYRWERKPVWNPASTLLDDSADIVFTDKAVYLLLRGGAAMRYPYGKIVNMGYKEAGFMVSEEAFFDVKTTSPFPHRFSIWNKYDKEKTEKVNLVLGCISGWGYVR